MGMPDININFKEVAVTSIKRGNRGTVALILRDTVPTQNPFVVLDTTDIPSTLSEENREQITLTLIGYTDAPKKVICYVIPTEAENYNDALSYLATEKFDILAIPTVATDGLETTVATWIKSQNTNDHRCKAILPGYKADDEHIINFSTESLISGDKTYSTEKYCARIAGLIAGTSMSISCTYAPLPELTDCTRLTKTEMDSAVDSGELIAFFDGEKVKLGRAVNSLTTETTEKKDQFKKIRVVEIMDMIYDDIKKTAQDSYLGKYPNSYDNKCLLMSAIGAYFDELHDAQMIDSYTIEIDIVAQRQYLKSIGKDVENMSEDEIKRANTKTKVFLKANAVILDTMEDINLPITI